MPSFQNISIRRKQTLIIMLTSGIVLLLSCVAISIYEMIAFPEAMVENLSTLADVVGDNAVAALDFDDAKSAAEALSTLKAQPSIIGACIYSKDGAVFATYDRVDDIVFTPPVLRVDGHSFTGRRLTMFRPVVNKGEIIGTVYLESDMKALYSLLWRFAGIVTLVLAVSLLIAFALSSRLQRLVSDPILHLAKVARSVTHEKNYALRATKQSNDELGQLVDGFNEMLEQIQQRDAALLAARDKVEARVVERTAELASANNALQERAGLATLEAEVSRALTQGGTLRETLQLCSEAIVHRLNAASARIWTFNEREGVLELQAGSGVETPLGHLHEVVPVGTAKSILGLIARERKPYLTNQAVGDLQFNDPAWVKREGLVGYAGYPLLVENQLMGVASIFARRPFTHPIWQTLGSLSNNIALGIERRRAEESLRLLVSAIEQSRESILITDAQVDLPGPRIIFANPAFTKMTGYSSAEILGKTPRILQGEHTNKAVLKRLREALAQGKGFEGETINYRKDGTEFDLEWQIAPIRNSAGVVTHFVAIQRDVTERKRLETKLYQSQKLETVGKLAGGIAHEFNSILTAIIGQSELLLGDLPAGTPLFKSATEISRAAGRAATLTRQLLAYGRKQILQPEILDLNRVIAGMEGAFHHILGGNVETRIIPAAGLHSVKADAGQVEQVIMNMTINARDAMPNGGKLTMETANVSFELESMGRYTELKPGGYVMLAITDTGSGMSEEVKARAFEPFFSTKGVGQGTGLGLSTCYGIIKQSGGHISLYSEVGRGTTFKIYLPQVELHPKNPPPPPGPRDLPRGTETILLVEDDPSLREMAATLLRRLGYTVLEAANGVEALSLKQRRDTGHVDLLFTDVVMPHMSGKELADRMRVLYPHTRILFTSAYTENAIVDQGVLNKGVALLQKPFTPSALAHKLREILDQPAAPTPGPAQQAPGLADVMAGENTP